MRQVHGVIRLKSVRNNCRATPTIQNAFGSAVEHVMHGAFVHDSILGSWKALGALLRILWVC